MATPERLEMTLAEAIYSMRAIRRVRPDPIADADIELILDAARQAPNGGNAQPWHFLVVQNADQIRRFAPLYREAWWAKRADAGITDPDDERLQTPVMRSARRLADEIGDAPLLIFLCATAQGEAAAASVIPSVQNLLLAARALGIGGNITTLHPSVDGRVKALFNIPEQAQVASTASPWATPRAASGRSTASHWRRSSPRIAGASLRPGRRGWQLGTRPCLSETHHESFRTRSRRP